MRCIVSEYALGTPPASGNFPRRNRIISGLAHGVLVIEAAAQSGSLITARLAGEFGREVMAIPGSPLDARSHGCNQLIREGAMLVQAPEDVIELVSGFDGNPRSSLREAQPNYDSIADEPLGGGEVQPVERLVHHDEARAVEQPLLRKLI